MDFLLMQNARLANLFGELHGFLILVLCFGQHRVSGLFDEASMGIAGLSESVEMCRNVNHFYSPVFNGLSGLVSSRQVWSGHVLSCWSGPVMSRLVRSSPVRSRYFFAPVFFIKLKYARP